MNKIIINATLTTVQPVSIKLPDQDGHPRMTRGLDSEGQPRKTAYIPATTLRGKLRRLAVQPLMQAAAAAKKPWTLHQVYEAMLGQDAASEAGEEIDLVALKKRRADNHIVDLFGAGLGVKSRLSVGHFVPTVNVEPENFAGVRKDLDSDTDVLDLMDLDEVARFVDRNTNNSKRSDAERLLKTMSSQIRKVEKTGSDVTELKAAMVLAEKNRDALVIAMGDMKNSTKTLTSYQAMPAGIELKSRIIIDKATSKDMVTVLGALDLFSRSPVLGGQTARGCGEVTGTFEMSDQDGALLGVLSVGGYAPSKMNWTANGEKLMLKNT
jgi:CRISPR type IV-associated protein Csf2